MNGILLFLGLVIFIGGIVCAIVLNSNKFKSKKAFVSFMLIFGAVCAIVSQSFTIISTGYTGVRSTFGQIENSTLQPGFHWTIPIAQTVSTVNNKQQDVAFSDQVFGESKERTVVYASDITVTYQINPEKSAYIYANVSNYEYNLVPQDLVNSSIKSAMVELDSSKVTQRGHIEPLAKEKIQLNLDEKYGENIVKVLKVVINNMDFEDSYNQAIAEKQIAQQAYEKQAIENKTALEKADADKQVAITNAEAAAQAKLIEAEAEAKANELLNEQLTNAILTDKWISKWDGKLPTVTTDSNTMISLPENIIEKTAE